MKFTFFTCKEKTGINFHRFLFFNEIPCVKNVLNWLSSDPPLHEVNSFLGLQSDPCPKYHRNVPSKKRGNVELSSLVSSGGCTGNEFCRGSKPHTAVSLVLPAVPTFWDSYSKFVAKTHFRCRSKATSPHWLLLSMKMHLRLHYGSTGSRNHPAAMNVQ